MKVFLSWSKNRSKEMAELLSGWLEQVIQAVEPWISTDIEKGARWSREISNKLEESRVGIICLTRENLDENWILFEVGALSKTKDAHVCTFLLDVKPTDIERPLGEFQHTKFEKEDVRKLLHTINGAVKKEGERALGETQLNNIFVRFWPELEEGLKKIVEQGPEVEKPTRSPEEMLEEMLERMRAMEIRQQEQLRETVVSSPYQSGPYALGTYAGPDYEVEPGKQPGTFYLKQRRKPLGEALEAADRSRRLYEFFKESQLEEEETKTKDKEVDFAAALKLMEKGKKKGKTSTRKKKGKSG